MFENVEAPIEIDWGVTVWLGYVPSRCYDRFDRFERDVVVRVGVAEEVNEIAHVKIEEKEKSAEEEGSTAVYDRA